MVHFHSLLKGNADTDITPSENQHLQGVTNGVVQELFVDDPAVPCQLRPALPRRGGAGPRQA